MNWTSYYDNYYSARAYALYVHSWPGQAKTRNDGKHYRARTARAKARHS